ncbi:TPA: inverse autotransporter beta domain-containing protein [Citrobacter gillenii]
MLIQVFLPLANAFTPTILHASTDSDKKEIKTRAYTLASGETAASVARHYHLSVNELYRLNDNRTFPNGFDSLRPGDEILVPEQPLLSLPTLMDDRAIQETGTQLKTNDAGTRLANVASQAGTFFSGSPGGDEAKNLARSALSGAATTQVQQWLSGAGTVRVRLDVNDKFSLKNSSLEVLHPLYDKNEWMFFAQGGVHRTDDRSQINLGIGTRHFSGENMIGMNTFLDHDLSHYHTRLGVGLEYWRDYLKLGANGYIRLSGWKESKTVEDYDERAANGWDVRAEAWLPSYPQLGGKLTYEQYYGNEVALSGKNDRQHNPQAITAGITYTPVPLLTLSAERNQGQSGRGDTILGMQLTVNPDMAWQQQINPDAVAAMRKLSGSRYDLVERNNNIVLEYRKREVIRLRLPERIEGRSQQIIQVVPDVQSKYGFRSIEWDDADLRAAGGKVTGQGMQWQLTLPVWQAGKVNAWLVTAIAHDEKDNTSRRAEMQVVLTAPVISTTDSSLTVSTDSVPADGQSQSTVTVTLKDTAGLPMRDLAEQISLAGLFTAVASSGSSSTPVSPHLGKLTEVSDGVYTTCWN